MMVDDSDVKAHAYTGHREERVGCEHVRDFSIKFELLRNRLSVCIRR